MEDPRSALVGRGTAIALAAGSTPARPPLQDRRQLQGDYPFLRSGLSLYLFAAEGLLQAGASRILDLGCAEALLLEALKLTQGSTFHYHGVEESAWLVAQNEKRHPGPFTVRFTEASLGLRIPGQYDALFLGELASRAEDPWAYVLEQERRYWPRVIGLADARHPGLLEIPDRYELLRSGDFLFDAPGVAQPRRHRRVMVLRARSKTPGPRT